MLPNGEVIPYAHFFTPSLSVKDIMKEVIEKEGKPLTDSEIVERLKERGIHIARRTVAKYRMQLAILPVHSGSPGGGTSSSFWKSPGGGTSLRPGDG